MIETQTGYQRRRAEQQIEHGALQTSLAAVHKVADAERAAAVVRDPHVLISRSRRAVSVGACAHPCGCLGTVWAGQSEPALRRASWSCVIGSLRSKICCRTSGIGRVPAESQLHVGLACQDARGARDHGRIETAMSDTP